jgi:tripartite-type tricarboxylate transporter receptor subunit TctC
MSPTFLIVPADSPYKTLADLSQMKACRANRFSSGGLYGMSHLPAEIFARAAGIKVRQFLYRGPSLTAIAGVGGFQCQLSSHSTSVRGNR